MRPAIAKLAATTSTQTISTAFQSRAACAVAGVSALLERAELGVFEHPYVEALVMAILLGLPLGLWAGLKPDAASSKAIMAGSILGFSLPTFWVGLMLIMVFSVMLGWLPSNGRGPTVMLLGIGISAAGVMLQPDYPRWSLPCRIIGFTVNGFAFLIGLDVIGERQTPALIQGLPAT